MIHKKNMFCRPRLSLLLAVIVAGGGILNQAVAQPPAKSIPAAAERARDFQVLRLQSAPAIDVARLLQEIFGGKPSGPATRIIADPRTNSLLIYATDDDVLEIKKLLKQLDSPDAADTEVHRQTRVFRLQAVEADRVLSDILRSIIAKSGKGNNFSLDPQRRLVVMTADDATLREVEAVLKHLEDSNVAAPEVDVQVRVVWLVNGLARADAPALPDDLKEVVASLTKVGIDKPQLAGQTLVNVSAGAKFQANGLAKLDTPCRFMVNGRVEHKRGSPTLEISIRAMRDKASGAEELGVVETQIAAPIGHFVVLGMTPTETMTSIFVVQIVPGTVKTPGKQK